MADQIFDKGALDLLKRSLDAYTLRQRVIAENIANAETPGYRTQSVVFESMLQKAIAEDGDVGMAGTQGGHISSETSPLPAPQIQVGSERAGDNGVNDVDMDMEMAALAETTLSHKMATRILALKYQGLRSAIRGRGTT